MCIQLSIKKANQINISFRLARSSLAWAIKRVNRICNIRRIIAKHSGYLIEKAKKDSEWKKDFHRVHAIEYFICQIFLPKRQKKLTGLLSSCIIRINNLHDLKIKRNL